METFKPVNKVKRVAGSQHKMEVHWRTGGYTPAAPKNGYDLEAFSEADRANMATRARSAE